MQALCRAHPGNEDNTKPLSSQTHIPNSIIPRFIHTLLDKYDLGQTSYVHNTKSSHALTESHQSKLEMRFRYLYMCVQSEMRVQYTGS